MNEKIKLGAFGENIACQYLIKNKHKIIERNYRKPWGEIDIIAKSPDNVLVFVEVKTIRQYGNAQFGNQQCGNEKYGNDECGNLENKKCGNVLLPYCQLPNYQRKRLSSFFYNAATKNNPAMNNAAIVNNSAIQQLPHYRIAFTNCRITPEMQMTSAKIKKLRRTASLYAGSHPELIEEKKGWRIDLFALTITEKDYLINYYNNI